jgi:hypothetical protein
VGSAGPKNNAGIKKAITPPLEVPVPPGTVVKRKSTGQVRHKAILAILLMPCIELAERRALPKGVMGQVAHNPIDYKIMKKGVVTWAFAQET